MSLYITQDRTGRCGSPGPTSSSRFCVVCGPAPLLLLVGSVLPPDPWVGTVGSRTGPAAGPTGERVGGAASDRYSDRITDIHSEGVAAETPVRKQSRYVPVTPMRVLGSLSRGWLLYSLRTRPATGLLWGDETEFPGPSDQRCRRRVREVHCDTGHRPAVARPTPRPTLHTHYCNVLAGNSRRSTVEPRGSVVVSLATGVTKKIIKR